MNAWNPYNQHCPTRLVLDRIADKWSVLIIGRLSTGTQRFRGLQRDIDGISQKMLTQTLRGLERDGIVSRVVFPTVPPRVEYSLTPLGLTLVDMLDAIRRWAEANIETVLAVQQRYNRSARPTARDGEPADV